MRRGGFFYFYFSLTFLAAFSSIARSYTTRNHMLIQRIFIRQIEGEAKIVFLSGIPLAHNKHHTRHFRRRLRRQSHVFLVLLSIAAVR
jgi:hypothetical protein